MMRRGRLSEAFSRKVVAVLESHVENRSSLLARLLLSIIGVLVSCRKNLSQYPSVPLHVDAGDEDDMLYTLIKPDMQLVNSRASSRSWCMA
jgi:hypothetical protein